jgi:hypothetical protein
MRTVIISILLLFIGCNDHTVKKMPAFIAASIATGEVYFLSLSPSPNQGDETGTEYVILETPTSPRQESVSAWQEGGSILLFGSGPDSVGWTQFGRLHTCNMLIPNNPDTVSNICFKQDGERWAYISWSDNILYEVVEGKAVGIAQIEFSRPYISETGEKRATIMTKRMGKDEKWCFKTDDGKVYLQEPDGKITQIGFTSWRVVTPPRGDKLVVVMAKGMEKSAKWQGKHNGKLYIEK